MANLGKVQKQTRIYSWQRSFKKVYWFDFLLAGQITDVSLLPHISQIGNANREWR